MNIPHPLLCAFLLLSHTLPAETGKGGPGPAHPLGARLADGGKPTQKVPEAVVPEEEAKEPDGVEFKVGKAATNAILVFKTEDGGQGTGFIVRRSINGSDRFFVYTNQHVIAGGKKLPKATRSDGSEVKLGKLVTAVNYDLAIFMLEGPEENFLELQGDVNKDVSVGDKLATPGNSGGGATITLKYGKVVAIGPELVEIDALIKGGNSGGPIIHENGHVIGIVAFFKKETKDDARISSRQQVVVRRFGYRVDNVKTWETPDWTRFSAQGERFGRVESLSKDLLELVNSKFTTWNGNESIGKIMRMVRNAKPNREGYNDAARCMTQLAELCRGDVDDISKDPGLYWWWKHNLKNERQLRDALSTEFENQAKEYKQKR